MMKYVKLAVVVLLLAAGGYFTFVFWSRSDMRAKYMAAKYSSPLNTYRILQTGERILNKHAADCGHSYSSMGKTDIVDDSGYVIYLAGLPRYWVGGASTPFLSGCDGCDSCYRLMQKARLIEYEVLNEDANLKRVRISLTSKGEKYALDNRMTPECSGYDKVIADKENGLRYVLFHSNKFSYKKCSVAYSKSHNICVYIPYWFQYTPFAQVLGFEDSGDATGMGSRECDLDDYNYRSGWKELSEVN